MNSLCYDVVQIINTRLFKYIYNQLTLSIHQISNAFLRDNN